MEWNGMGRQPNEKGPTHSPVKKPGQNLSFRKINSKRTIGPRRASSSDLKTTVVKVKSPIMWFCFPSIQ